MTDQVKPQPLLTPEIIEEIRKGARAFYPSEFYALCDLALQAISAPPKDAKRPEMWDEFKLTNKVKRMEFRDHIRELQAYIAALPRSEPKEAGDEYEGDTAKGWYEAWNRENDAWQKMVQHHEELEEAVKVMLKDGMKPTEYLEAMEKVRRILAIEGSAPAKSAPEAEGVRALVKAIKEAAWYRGTEGGMDRDWEENAEGVEPIALDATEIWPAYQAVKAALGDL